MTPEFLKVIDKLAMVSELDHSGQRSSFTSFEVLQQQQPVYRLMQAMVSRVALEQ